jgi:Zn-dependent protease
MALSEGSYAFTPLVARVMAIEDTTWGDPAKNYLVRYRGRLHRADSEAAYNELAEALHPLEVTPLFRMEGEQHVILLLPGLIRSQPAKIWVNVVLLVLTIISMFIVGAASTIPIDSAELSLVGVYVYALTHIYAGWPFAVSMIAILIAHEGGHYVMGRLHKTSVTLPYFIPLPVPGGFGTLGAVIQMKDIPKNRRHLLDIGLAGPLAGFLVAVPVLLIGLLTSGQPHTVALSDLQQGLVFEGNSLTYLLLKFIVFGKLLPAPASYTLPPLLHWVVYFFSGLPIPLGAQDIMVNQVAWAGWAGLLVTALNLIPAGQLDGGHLIYVLLGRRARRLVPVILVALAIMGFAWMGWWLWAFLIFTLGRAYAEPLDLITPVDGKRKALAVLGLVLFAFVFTPVPLKAFGPEALSQSPANIGLMLMPALGLVFWAALRGLVGRRR